jgi:hypothetical protein
MAEYAALFRPTFEEEQPRMNKYSCSMASISDIFFATLVAEDEAQAKELAIAETKQGQPRNWSARVLEPNVEGPARVLASGKRDA